MWERKRVVALCWTYVIMARILLLLNSSWIAETAVEFFIVPVLPFPISFLKCIHTSRLKISTRPPQLKLVCFLNGSEKSSQERSFYNSIYFSTYVMHILSYMSPAGTKPKGTAQGTVDYLWLSFLYSFSLVILLRETRNFSLPILCTHYVCACCAFCVHEWHFDDDGLNNTNKNLAVLSRCLQSSIECVIYQYSCRVPFTHNSFTGIDKVIWILSEPQVEYKFHHQQTPLPHWKWNTCSILSSTTHYYTIF